MHQSDSKPKVISRNLEDIIKQSAFSTKRNSIQELLKCQKHLKTQPRQKKPNQRNERCNTYTNYTSNIKQSAQRLNTSMSKHSLESKGKIAFIDASKVTVNCNVPGQTKKNKNSMIEKGSSSQFHPSNAYSSKQVPSQSQFVVSSHHTQSLYFNQMDAVFTELEDYLRETRERVCMKMGYFNNENNELCRELTDEIGELIVVFKQEMERLIKECFYQKIDILKPKNKTPQKQYGQSQKPTSSANKPKHSATATIEQYPILKQEKFKQQQFFHEQLIRIQQFMQRQQTVNSTIMSQPQQDQLPTETDLELLSMLMFKNKLSNTKRKYPNSNKQDNDKTHFKQSGRGIKESPQPEYSFRNKNINSIQSHSYSKQPHCQYKDSSTINNTFIQADKRKRPKHLVTQKSSNKQNRQKTIYQIVLEENRRKGNLIK